MPIPGLPITLPDPSTQHTPRTPNIPYVLNLLMLETFLDRADTLFHLLALKQPDWISRTNFAQKMFIQKLENHWVHEDYRCFADHHTYQRRNGEFKSPTPKDYVKHRIKHRSRPSQETEQIRHRNTNIMLALYPPNKALRRLILNFRQVTTDLRVSHRRFLKSLLRGKEWKLSAVFLSKFKESCLSLKDFLNTNDNANLFDLLGRDESQLLVELPLNPQGSFSTAQTYIHNPP
jgi:hypothetical protein